MSAQARTAGPWKIHKLGFDTCDIGSESENQLTCTAFGFGVEHTEANAAFIVKACNAHDELVAALQLALQGLEVAASNSPNNEDEAFIGYVFAADKARAALAKVQP